MEADNTAVTPPDGAQRFKKYLKPSIIVIVGTLVLLTLGAIFFVFTRPESVIVRPAYAAVYTLVADSISKNAEIVVTLPKGISREIARSNIKFTPSIKGEWLPKGTEQQVIYKPANALKAGVYYTVSLETPAGTIGKDFLAADDPEVSAIFPANGSEANEKSSITVIFNRPMVALSTLDVMRNDQMPLVVTPPTAGKYKWVGTRTVQFIPTDRLTRSTHYTVTVASNLASNDGLAVKPVSAQFITRPLRYEYLTDANQPLIYDQPITLHFNQPVDFSRTVKEISVVNVGSGKPVDVVVEYGSSEQYDQLAKKNVKVEDRSTLLVYQARDSHGRGKLWDFSNQYALTINKAYPSEGDIALEESRQTTVNVTDIISYTGAISDHSSLVTPTFFDPTGKLVIRFFEPISIKDSNLEAPGLTNIEYGQKCEPGTENQGDNDCPKVPDHMVLMLRFNPATLTPRQTFQVTLRDIVNDSNFKINATPLTIEVTTVPRLALLRTFPANNSVNGDVGSLILCSNSPLVSPDSKNVGRFLKVDPVYEFKYWGNSYPVSSDLGVNHCQVGEYETDISYGLMPQTDYHLDLDLEDHFGSKTTGSVSFKSGDVPSASLNFYHFQKEYNVTSPSNTVLSYASENMEYVDVTLCRLSPESMISVLANKPQYTVGPVGDCLEKVNSRISLPKRFWLKNYFTVDIAKLVSDPIGHFVLTFTNPNYKDQEGKQIFERTYLSVTRLSVVEKKIEMWDKARSFSEEDKIGSAVQKKLSNVYWVADLATLRPVVGAAVSVFTVTRDLSTTFAKVLTVNTNDKGIAIAAPISDQGAIIVKKGADSALAYDESQLGFGDTAQALSKLYLYSDRPIYRPGDSVGIKGIYRVGYDGKFSFPTGHSVTLKIFDSAEKEIFSKEVVVNDFGTFNATTTLDRNAPLGSYRIDVDGRGFGFFDVQEYVPAAFKIDAAADKEEYIAGDTLNLNVNANYYFGVPVQNGTIEYSIVSQNYYFDKYKGNDYFQFGRDWYDCYDNCFYGDKFITRGTATLDANGKATLSEKLDFRKWFTKETEQGSKLITVYITVKNPAGQAVSTNKTVIVHAGEYYLGLASNSSFAAKNQPVTMKVKSVSISGTEVQVSNVKLAYNRVRWISNQRQGLDGGYYYTWERKLDSVRQTTIATDEHGNASDVFTPDKEGEYEVDVQGTDRRGNTIAASYFLYVYGDQPVADLRPSNDNSLELVVKQPNVSVGDSASFIIKSPYAHAKALISIERGDVYHYEVVDIPPGFYLYHFPVTDDYIPNVFVSVVLLSDKPEIKYGEASFQVDSKQRHLTVTVHSNKQNYLPGENVTLDFTAKDSEGRGVKTEFSAAVVDESVLALVGNPKKNPSMFFYDGLPLTVSTLSNLKNILYKVDLPIGTKGGGGGAPDLARQKRGDFRDTAYWNAVIRTDANGQAEVSFKLPDNLTTWQTEALGVTQNTLTGAGYGEFTSSKNIMAVPLKPRFVLPGDEFALGATVFNHTNARQTLTATFQSGSLTLVNGKSKIDLSVPPNSSAPVYFNVAAPSAISDGEHKFTIAVKNSAYEDVVEDVIPVDRNDTYETVATGGFSLEPVTRETFFVPSAVENDKGEITIKSSATLAIFLSDALKSMLDYQYDSCEEIGSKLQTVAILKRASELKNMSAAFPVTEIPWNGRNYPVDEAVRLGLNDLYAHQNSDGGFFYYYSYGARPSSLYLSMHIAGVLSKVKAAGFPVDDQRLTQLDHYLTVAEANGTGYGQFDDNTEVLIAAALNDLVQYGTVNKSLNNRVRAIANNKAFLNEHASNLVLTKLYSVLHDQSAFFEAKDAKKVLDILGNRLQIDSRGSYLAPNQNFMWEYYESNVRDTALYVQAIAKAGEKSPVIDRLLRWIIASRSKDGSWGSTPNTLSVVDAFTDYLIMSRENESDFTLTTVLNGTSEGSKHFAASTVLDQNSLTVPLAGLPRDVLLPLSLQKATHNNLQNTLYYDVAMRYFLPMEALPPRDEGFAITRALYQQDDSDGKNSVVKGQVGEVLRVHDEIIVPQSRNFVALEDFIPAGAEIVNTDLATADQSVGIDQKNQDQLNEGLEKSILYPTIQESRDDRYYAVVEHLEPGTYTVDYYIRLLVPGTFQYRPARVSENYFPENFGRTGGSVFTISR